MLSARESRGSLRGCSLTSRDWAEQRPKREGASVVNRRTSVMKGLRPARRRVRAQSIVEVAVVFPLLILAGVGVIQFALWMHAEGVVTAAVQDGARAASSETGSLADGQTVAATLLRDGLGPTALLVNVVSTE